MAEPTRFQATWRPEWGKELGIAIDDADPGELSVVNGDTSAGNGREVEGEDGWCSYTTVHEWVTEWALPTLGRSTLGGGQRWCNRWDAHPC